MSIQPTEVLDRQVHVFPAKFLGGGKGGGGKASNSKKKFSGGVGIGEFGWGVLVRTKKKIFRFEIFRGQHLWLCLDAVALASKPMLIVASGDSRQKDLSALLTFAHGAIFSCFGSKWGRRQVYVLVLFSSASEILLSANSSLSGEWKGRDPRERKPQLSNCNESLSNFIPYLRE